MNCTSNGDCNSGLCMASICQAPLCTDGMKNGLETDVDCGGPDCGKCVAGKRCNVVGDCATYACTGGVCGYQKSCKDIRNAGGATSGVYAIKPGSAPVQTYCEMVTQGGGWTFVARSDATFGWGTGIIQTDFGTFDPTRGTANGTYSLGSSVNMPLWSSGLATQMLVTVDTSDPSVAFVSSKGIIFQPAGTPPPMFMVGPPACSGSPYTYSLGSSFVSGAYSACTGATFSPGNPSALPLVQTAVGVPGVTWGAGMGGNMTANHAAWWYVR
jgi:hypothetical protein